MDFQKFNHTVLNGNISEIENAINTLPERGRKAMLMSACCTAFSKGSSDRVVELLAPMAGLTFSVRNGTRFLRRIKP